MGYCECGSLRICDCGLLLGGITVILGCCDRGLLLLLVVAIIGYFDCGQRVKAISAYCNCGPICDSDHAPGQINGFARATEIPISFVFCFSWKFRSWMVLFGSLIDEFVSSLARANVLSIFEFDAGWLVDFLTRILIYGFNEFETFFYLNFHESKIKIYVGVDDNICDNLEFWNSLLELGWFAGSMVGSTILLFFRYFFWRSGLLEYWIRSYVRCRWSGCSLRHGTPLYSSWTLDSSALSWSLTLQIKEQQR